MRSPVRRVVRVNLWPLSLSVSLAHVLLDQQPQNFLPVQPRRKRHDFYSSERWRKSNEVGLTSAQAGRGPPSRSRFNSVRHSSITPFT